MPTLLSVNNYHYSRGGAETVFLEHNRLFTDAGWKVVPFSMRHPSNLKSPWSEFFVDEIELGSRYNAVEKLARVSKVIYSLEARRKIGKLIEAVRPDVCHAHNVYHHISPSIFFELKRRQIPCVLTLHDLKIACPAYNMLANDGICERCRGGRLRNVVMHRCIKGSLAMSSIAFAEAWLHRWLRTYERNVDRLIVPSQFYIDKFCEWGWQRSKFTHVPNFIQASRYQPRFEPGRRFIYFGRLAREKGLSTLIAASAKARVPLSIVGSGPMRQELERSSQAVGADVTFLGYLTGDALHDAVRKARAVVVPSEWYENAPMSVLEAYALGKPVIAARIGGLPELVTEAHTGISFVSGNADSLAAALADIDAAGDERIRVLGKNARQWVEEEFSEQQYRSRTGSIYAELGANGSVEQTALASPTYRGVGQN